MKAIAILLIAAVLCQSALAVSSKSKSKMLLAKINTRLEKSHLGRALKNMISISSRLGYNYEDLFDAFDALKNNLLERLNT